MKKLTCHRWLRYSRHWFVPVEDRNRRNSFQWGRLRVHLRWLPRTKEMKSKLMLSQLFTIKRSLNTISRICFCKPQGSWTWVRTIRLCNAIDCCKWLNDKLRIRCHGAPIVTQIVAFFVLRYLYSTVLWIPIFNGYYRSWIERAVIGGFENFFVFYEKITLCYDYTNRYRLLLKTNWMPFERDKPV